MNFPIATLVTAAQIEASCPDKLLDLGKRITVHLDKAARCDERAANHRNSATQCLLQAQEACDAGGFRAFCARFGIGKSFAPMNWSTSPPAERASMRYAPRMPHECGSIARRLRLCPLQRL